MNQKTNEKDWDLHLQKTLDLWGAPGLSAVVLKDNEVVYTKGFGFRDIENKAEMTKDTIHPIASCTKSFTSTAIAMLVDEGKLEWNTPIHEFIPHFKLKDPVASSHVTIVDMLSHRTGLPRHDIVWIDDEFTYDQILNRLPHLDLCSDIRMKFQYCNLMYLAASAIIQELSGMSYNDFITKRIFKPLGMKNSNFSVTDMEKTPNYARPYKIDYKKEEFGIIPCEFVVNDAATGAGCINASIDDMGKWLAFHLNNGKAGNKQLVSPENLSMTHNPVIIVSAQGLLSMYIPDQKWFRMQTMALGWEGLMYRGYRLVTHSGGIDGSSSRMAFLPDENTGVMAIVNQSYSYLHIAAMYHLVDKILRLDPVDWNTAFKPLEDSQTKAIKESGEQSQDLRKTDTQPTHDHQEYVGIYHHPGYGKFDFYLENGELKTKYGTINYPLTHYHYDTFQFEVTRFDFKELLTFQTDSNGDIVGFTIKVEETLPPILFKRLPDAHLRDKKFLKTLIGKYDVAGRILEIAFKRDDTIMAVSAGQPAIELEGVRGMRFKTKDSGHFSITFKKDESGKISEFLYSEMAFVIPAKRIS
ncbi:MAG: serine hydrolase [Candidatus Thorarchaeota archaeon]|jgi:CubicO group peptidase (beta-lactamase class C family)